MGNTSKTWQLDPEIAINKYFQLLEYAVLWLPLFVDRDLEGERLLSVPALSEALRREDRRYWDRYHAERRGKIAVSRRIWTRRDESYVVWKSPYGSGGWCPSRRTDRLAERLMRYHGDLYPDVYREERASGTLNEVGALLREAKDAFFDAINSARSVAGDRHDRNELTEANRRLMNLRNTLWDHLVLDSADQESVETTPEKKKKSSDTSSQEKVGAKRRGPKPKAKEKLRSVLIAHHGDGTVIKTTDPLAHAEMARQCKVSKSRITDYLTGIGFESYREYREICEHFSALKIKMQLLDQGKIPDRFKTNAEESLRRRATSETDFDAIDRRLDGE